MILPWLRQLNKKHIVTILLAPQIKNHLSSFEFGFLNIFSRQNLLRSLSLVLSLLHDWKYGTKNVQKTTFDSTSEMIRLWSIRKQEKQ